MGNNTVPRQDWYEKAAFEIARNGGTLFQYANMAGLGLTSRECENVARTKEFQTVLRTERNKLYKELANDPSRNRNTAIGQLIFAITQLLEAGQYDKAVTALSQLFKAEGWTSDSAQVAIFNDLKSTDIDALRAKLLAQKK